MLILLLAIVYPCRFKHFINDLIKNPCVTTMQFSFLLSNSRIILLHLSTVSILLSFCLLLFKNHCKRPIIFQIHSGILIEQSTNDLKGTSSTSISQLLHPQLLLHQKLQLLPLPNQLPPPPLQSGQ